MKYDLALKSRVHPLQVGKPLLEAVSTRFTYRDQEYWAARIAAGEVLLNGERTTPETLVREGDELELLIPGFEEPDLDTAYQVIWENPDVIVVNKPADLPVHSTRRFFFQTMTAVLQRDRPDDQIHPIHRLDRETSGLMVFARHRAAQRRLQANIHRFLRGKYYLALVFGRFPRDEWLVNAPLAEIGLPPVGCKMRVSPDGKPAETLFRLIGCDGQYSLLLADIRTGRKHQIRAHLEHLGFPIVGDKLYSHDGRFFLKRWQDQLEPADLETLGARHHLLHAYAAWIAFPDGATRLMRAETLPAEFSRYLSRFPGWNGRVIEWLERQKPEVATRLTRD